MVTHNLEEAYRLGGDKVVKLIGCPITDFEIIKEKSE